PRASLTQPWALRPARAPPAQPRAPRRARAPKDRRAPPLLASSTASSRGAPPRTRRGARRASRSLAVFVEPSRSPAHRGMAGGHGTVAAVLLVIGDVFRVRDHALQRAVDVDADVLPLAMDDVHTSLDAVAARGHRPAVDSDLTVVGAVTAEHELRSAARA